MPSRNKYPKDIAGIKFGLLTPIKIVEVAKNGRSKWLCKCDCGNSAIVWNHNLLHNHTQSCGCLQKKRASEATSSHKMTGTRLYRTWHHMRERCFNRNTKGFKNYGGRGITVCNEWLIFENFRDWAFNNGYSDNLTIERINVDGDYCPNNCKWIPMESQAKNKRTNHFFTINGDTKTMTDWAYVYGIKPTTVFCRLYHGWDELSALTRPTKNIAK